MNIIYNILRIYAKQILHKPMQDSVNVVVKLEAYTLEQCDKYQGKTSI